MIKRKTAIQWFWAAMYGPIALGVLGLLIVTLHAAMYTWLYMIGDALVANSDWQRLLVAVACLGIAWVSLGLCVLIVPKK